MQKPQVDQEALALARCYALLIRKAQEHQTELAAQAATENAESDAINSIDDEHVELDSAVDTLQEAGAVESPREIVEVQR
ncbi:MAG: hypothetical protein H6658_12400 [Ardenticatenaceae bacterium]|nr:hypothetical protein [Ardenticatenaceae bacterium]